MDKDDSLKKEQPRKKNLKEESNDKIVLLVGQYTQL